MQHLTVCRELIFTQEMEILRRECFPGSYPSGSSQEPFDYTSTHVCIRIDEELAAYIRLTGGPDAVYKTWSNGTAPVPSGKNCADLTRCFVNRKFRKLGLMTLVCLEGLVAASEHGFEFAIGSVLPGMPFQKQLEQLGMLPTGPLFDELEPSGDVFRVQPIVCEIARWRDSWPSIREDQLSILHQKGLILATR